MAASSLPQAAVGLPGPASGMPYKELTMAIIWLPQAVGIGSAHSTAHLHVICLALCCLQLRLQLLCSCSALLQPAFVSSVMAQSLMPVDCIPGLGKRGCQCCLPWNTSRAEHCMTEEPVLQAYHVHIGIKKKRFPTAAGLITILSHMLQHAASQNRAARWTHLCLLHGCLPLLVALEHAQERAVAGRARHMGPSLLGKRHGCQFVASTRQVGVHGGV